VYFPILDNDGDLVTSGAGLDSERSIDGGTAADCSNEATEIATTSGLYYLDLIYSELQSSCTIVKVQSSTSNSKDTVLVLYPKRLPVLRTNTAQAGAAATITLDAGASTEDEFYAGCLIQCTNNSPANVQGQTRKILSYDGTTKIATVNANWGTNPSNATTFDILFEPGQTPMEGEQPSVQVAAIGSGVIDATAIATDAIGSAELAASAVGEIADGVWDEARAGHVAGGSFGEGVASVQGNVTGSVGSVTGNVGGNVVGTVASVVGAVGSVTGNVGGNVTGSVGSVAAGGITAASFGAGAIDAAAIANAAIDAATFAAGAIDAAAIAADAIGASELATSAVDEIVDQVWDELIAGHLGVGSTGEAAALARVSRASRATSRAVSGRSLATSVAT
jgi:hypothetical protein